jgi:hypothetical protein
VNVVDEEAFGREEGRKDELGRFDSAPFGQ